LWDYLQDDKLLMRLNQIMRRVKLPDLPDDFIQIILPARHLIADRIDELL
jgi:hypothetical protein